MASIQTARSKSRMMNDVPDRFIDCFANRRTRASNVARRMRITRSVDGDVGLIVSRGLVWALLFQFFVVGLSGTADAADDPKSNGLIRANQDKRKSTGKDAEGEIVLPKYSEMELPSAEEILRAKPFDWIILKNTEVLVVEPIGWRPTTLIKLNAEYERYLKGKAGYAQGEERLSERRRQFLRVPLTLIDPGPDREADYTIETKLIQKIEYFEDLVLNRTNLLIGEEQIPPAYDLLLLVDRRHRENNLRLKDAYETLKSDEAAAATEEERLRYSVPEQPPLKLGKFWPGFDETYQRLLFADGGIRSAKGDHESGLRILEDLWDRNRAFPGLSERMGQVVDHLIAAVTEREDFRQARFYLGRLTAREPQHLIAVKWKSDLIARTNETIAIARAAASAGDAALAARTVDHAARIWPETPGLKDAHRELNDKYQSVRLGLLRLPGERTSFPFETDAELFARSLTEQTIFEPVRVDERGVRYRSTILESWEPMDLGRNVQFNLRLKRADWEARPLMTSADIFSELSGKIDPERSTYDERLSGIIERISVQSPSQFSIQFRRLPLRLEALFQFPVTLDEESRGLNPDLEPGALPTAGRQRFYEFERDPEKVVYHRVRPHVTMAKTRHVDEIVTVRYESWDRALQGLLRGEIAGIPRVDFRDLIGLQDDNRFFVIPYTLPVSHMILFNPHSVPLRDTQLRRALTLAIPRDEFIRGMIPDNAKSNLVRLAATPFPSVGYGHNRLIEEPPYDPQRAAALVMTAKKQAEGSLPTLRMVCPPDSQIRAAAIRMVEHWRRIGVTVQLNDETDGSSDRSWDLAYRTMRIAEPLTAVWPLLTFGDDASVGGLKPLPERIRRQLLELERANDWTTATRQLHRIESELLVETRYIPLWEVDEFFVARRHLIGMPTRLMSAFHDVERWTLQSWYPQDAP